MPGRTKRFQISEAEIAAFNQDGVVPIHGAIDSSWLRRLSDAIERDIESPGPFYHGYTPENGEGRFHGNVRLWEGDPDFASFCLESSLPGMASRFLEATKVNLLYDQLFVKEPRTINRTRWHNDQPYWPIRGWQVLSFWVALDDTTYESGALEFVRGSHRWGRWFQPEKFGDTGGHSGYERNPDYEPMPDLDSARDDYDIVSWDRTPGDMYVFHGLTVHGARGNSSGARRRRGYTVRYTGDDVVYDTSPGSNEHLRNAEKSDGDRLDSERYPVVLHGIANRHPA